MLYLHIIHTLYPFQHTKHGPCPGTAHLALVLGPHVVQYECPLVQS